MCLGTQLKQWSTRKVRLLHGVLIGGMLASWLLPGIGMPGARDLSEEDYCRLTAEMLETSIDEWHERLVVLRQYGTQSLFYLSELASIGQRYSAMRERVLSRYGTTTSEYLAYMGAHETSVKSYLANDEAAQATIDALARQLASLVAQYEAVAGK